MTAATGQFVRFLFLRLDPAWRRLDPALQHDGRLELGEAILHHRSRMLVRSYSLAGTRGDSDLMFWQAADQLEAFQGFQTAILSTRMGGHFSIPYSYLGTVRRSPYELPPDPAGHPIRMQPQDARYLFVYPFVKHREWYALPSNQRQSMMEEHIRVGRRFPGFRLNTLYSFGLDDQEFVVAFEGDDPSEFVSLVMALRETAAAAFTVRDTPVFTCLQMSVWDALDSLGGAVGKAAGPTAGDGFVEVAALGDVPDGGATRVYHGADAIAIFRVNGRLHAVSDRCTHGRASLCQGVLDPARGVLTCPWHGGQFDIATGEARGEPAHAPIRVYQVKLDGSRILVR